MQINKEDRIGLVFSGGGARGAYQMGVWRALRELGVDRQVTVITGTSIGAINAAAFVQDDYDLALEIWQETDFDTVFDSIPKRSEMNFGRLSYSILKDLIQKRGLAVSGYRERIRSIIDENRIRQASIDFGMVVYNLSERQAERLFVEEIETDLVADYIIASSNLPVFESFYLKGQKYMDGGFVEVVPLDLCMQKQDKFDKLIVVNITSFPYPRLAGKDNYKEKPCLLLSPLRSIASPIDFTNTAMLQAIQQGYVDTMHRLKVTISY